MVDAERLIAPEIADLYGRSLKTIERWRSHPDWPKPVGKRGRWAEYDAAAVDAAVRALFLPQFLPHPPAEDGDPDELLTIDQAAQILGVKRKTLDADRSRGRFPQPDDTAHGVPRWRRATVEAVKRSRRPYRRRT